MGEEEDKFETAEAEKDFIAYLEKAKEKEIRVGQTFASNNLNPYTGVSIFPKNWVFYKVWYERLEFFLKRPSVVFIKGG